MEYNFEKLMFCWVFFSLIYWSNNFSGIIQTSLTEKQESNHFWNHLPAFSMFSFFSPTIWSFALSSKSLRPEGLFVITLIFSSLYRFPVKFRLCNYKVIKAKRNMLVTLKQYALNSYLNVIWIAWGSTVCCKIIIKAFMLRLTWNCLP